MNLEQKQLVEKLTAIWSRTLETDVAPDANFFELGGDSLLAVNMFLEIEQATGCHIPITAIYDAPTIAELAAFMQQEAAVPFNPLVLLKEGGSGAPLFIAHGVGGTVIDLAAVGRLIESDGPVYAIQARGVDGQDAPLLTIEEMADYYVETVRTIAPHGPYRLAGYSFGGMVAVEMARRFGPENVNQLILLDAFAHPQTWPKFCRYQVRIAKLARQLRAKVKLPPREIAAFVLGKITRRNGKVASQDDRLIALHDWLGTVRADLPAPLRETRIAGSKALLGYWPKYYPGKITFLKARTKGDTFPMNARRVWGHMVQQMELHTIPGSHASIVSEHAATTAAAISAKLAPTAEPKHQPLGASFNSGKLRPAPAP